MNKPAKPAIIRFYVDADVLGLAKILVQMRSDVTYPGDPGGVVKGRRFRPPCPISDPGTPDRVWIPETAERDWLIITRDRHIQDHHAKIEAVRVSGARMVNLSGAEALDTFHQMEALMCQWQKVFALLDRPGPFICSLTRTTLRPLLLDF
jgi:PIN domain-containing protein